MHSSFIILHQLQQEIISVLLQVLGGWEEAVSRLELISKNVFSNISSPIISNRPDPAYY